MSLTLDAMPETEQSSLLDAEAMDAQFKDPFFGFSEEFGKEHKDLVKERVGVVLQAGVLPDGEPITFDNPLIKDSVANITLTFDARSKPAGRYDWWLTRTNPVGRTDFWLQSTPSGNVAIVYQYNHQGKLVNRRTLDSTEANDLGNEVQDLIYHPIVKESIEELHQKKVAVGADRIGFTALAPFEPSLQAVAQSRYYSNH